MHPRASSPCNPLAPAGGLELPGLEAWRVPLRAIRYLWTADRQEIAELSRSEIVHYQGVDFLACKPDRRRAAASARSADRAARSLVEVEAVVDAWPARQGKFRGQAPVTREEVVEAGVGREASVANVGQAVAGKCL